MKRNYWHVWLGLIICCLPVPMLIFSSKFFLFVNDPISNVIAFLFIFLVPALFLIIGFRYAQRNDMLTRSFFLQSSTAIGIAIGLFVIVPLSVLLAPTPLSNLLFLEKLFGILSVTTFVSLCYGALFWTVAVRHLSIKNGHLTEDDEAIAAKPALQTS